ncbi:iron uptake porin [Synechococcus sp. MIT S9508]|uniref:iron uptake porin n=1 Tax=Synechococcus sp. MIT S9508 TaxID=1801629 RepID=UPI0007BBC75C|nr:iron uptake porin [Synechococcus sp. MIT S9508]KZR87484.1 Carbohydrate-selective porin, OprB family [Synechococcus sp. MIT S9508]
MKLFKQLLVAPAALGLMAPVAAVATEVSVSDYTNVSSDAVAVDQVTSINQFNDVFPADWAYQALSNLIERYGCVAGYPNGTFRGNRAMTRFEAAALLNACLDRVTEVTDELKRLIKEFEKELAIVKGRVDGLEARVGELEATQFSTTTKLKGRIDMVLGGISYGGSGAEGTDSGTPANQNYGLNTGSDYKGQDALTFNYTAQFDLNTSFTGKDLLYTRIKTGNFSKNFYNQDSDAYGQSNLADLAVGNSNGDTLKVDKLWYQFPIGSSFTAYVGPKIEHYYMLGSTPSVYRQILKQFKLGGYYGAYGASTSPGAGLAWRQQKDDRMSPRFTVSTAYTASEGDHSCIRGSSCGGIGTNESSARWTSQIAYGNPQWNISAAYQYAQEGGFKGYGTPVGKANYYINSSGALTKGSYADVNSVALRAWWQPSKSGWMPSISTGWGLSSFSDPAVEGDELNYSSTSQNWFVGLNWKDAFMKGNILGAAIAQSLFKTSMKNYSDNNGARDGNYSMELYYQFQVTDNISVTPTIFYLSRPYGQLTGSETKYGGNGADSFNMFGYLVQSTFRF